MAVAGLAGPAAFGADFESLSQVESASETRDYSQQVRDKKFGPEQDAFLTGILLPQLTQEANRTAIARTRQRIRELALRDAAAETFQPINARLLEAMLDLAGDRQAEPLIRVNAMLMVGELVGPDGKPWPGAARPLADATADATLPPELRIAALAGLARHAETATPELAAAAGPAVAALVATPPEGDPAAIRWLQSRALELLPALSPPPAAVAAAAKLLADEALDHDLRVRAAVALGRLARPDAGIDAAAAVDRIHGLAIAALEADLAAAEARRLDRKIGGTTANATPGGPAVPAPPAVPGRGPGGIFGVGPFGGPTDGVGLPAVIDEDAVPRLACRRNAWRLYGLAEAVKPAREGGGLAGLLDGESATQAVELATILRQAAIELDAQPDEKTLVEGLESIRGAGRPAEGTARGGEEKPGQASPFDEPASPPAS